MSCHLPPKALDVLPPSPAQHATDAAFPLAAPPSLRCLSPLFLYHHISAACASLYGPLHGGANEAVIRMLIEIGDVKNVPAFIERVKRKEVVLSGFGHRIYRTSDPRSFM